MIKKFAFVDGQYIGEANSPKNAKLYIVLNSEEDEEFFLSCLGDNEQLFHEQSCSDFEADIREVLLKAWFDYEIAPNDWNLILSEENLEYAHFKKLKRIVDRYQELSEIQQLVYGDDRQESHKLFSKR